MGVRLYAPVLGRFLSTDPVYGGNSTTYGYPTDPINAFDLDGKQRAGDEGGGSWWLLTSLFNNVKSAGPRKYRRDWGTGLAGVTNAVWGYSMIIRGASVVMIGFVAIPFTGGLSGGAAYSYGGYQIAGGFAKFVKGARGLQGFRTKCKASCDLGGNAKRFFRKVVPFGSLFDKNAGLWEKLGSVM
jgi:hypothetical protein